MKKIFVVYSRTRASDWVPVEAFENKFFADRYLRFSGAKRPTVQMRIKEEPNTELTQHYLANVLGRTGHE